MIITIPSKNRIDYTAGKTFKKHTLFVEPQDYEKYTKLFKEQKIIKIGENDKGFSFVLNEIVKYTLEQKEKYFLFIDDDIFGMKRKDKKEFDAKKFAKKAEKLIQEKKYAQLGISFGGHNWFESEEIKENKAVWGMGVMDAEVIDKIGGYDKNLILFSDYEITARLLLNGYNVGIWYKYFFLHKMKSKEGGAMVYYKQSNLIKEQCEYLQNKYGKLCKMFFNKSHGIYEVRFDWRKIMLYAKMKIDPNKLLK